MFSAGSNIDPDVMRTPLQFPAVLLLLSPAVPSAVLLLLVSVLVPLTLPPLPLPPLLLVGPALLLILLLLLLVVAMLVADDRLP